MAKRSAEDSKVYQPGAIISVVFAAMAVEGFVNDFIGEVSWTQVDKLDPPLALLRELASAIDLDARQTSLFLKIQVIHVALIGTRCDMGQPPFQDLDVLLGLRNALVHSRPEKLKVVDAITPDGVPTHHQEVDDKSLVARLAKLGIVPAPPKEVLTSMFAVLHHPRVAVWAYNTAIVTIKFLVTLIPSPGWQAMLSVNIPTMQLDMPPL